MPKNTQFRHDPRSLQRLSRELQDLAAKGIRTGLLTRTDYTKLTEASQIAADYRDALLRFSGQTAEQMTML